MLVEYISFIYSTKGRKIKKGELIMCPILKLGKTRIVDEKETLCSMCPNSNRNEDTDCKNYHKKHLDSCLNVLW